jgi:hypothetical protein
VFPDGKSQFVFNLFVKLCAHFIFLKALIKLASVVITSWPDLRTIETNEAYFHVFEWLRRGFGLANRFIGSSLVVTKNNCNTFKITVIIIHKVFNSHVKSSQVFYEIPVAVPYRELNWTQLESELLYDWRRADHSSKESYRLWIDHETEKRVVPTRGVQQIKKLNYAFWGQVQQSSAFYTMTEECTVEQYADIHTDHKSINKTHKYSVVSGVNNNSVLSMQ